MPVRSSAPGSSGRKPRSARPAARIGAFFRGEGARMKAERTLCSACGFASEAGVRFCGGCARPLTRVEPGVRRPLPAAAALTPAHLAQRILPSPGAIEGEPKLVTVVFVDLLRSLEVDAGADPEQGPMLLRSLR